VGGLSGPNRFAAKAAPTKGVILTLYREMAAGVDAFPEVFARLKVRHVLAGQGDSFAGLGIAPDARWPEMQRKAAKPPYLYALALGKRVTHQVQKMLDC